MSFSRRSLALLPVCAAAPARASDLVVVGRDGWLFAAWEDIRRGNLAGVRQVADLIAEAAGVLNRAGVAMCIALVPLRARIYPDMLPAEFRMSAEAEARYATLLARWQAAGILMPDLAARFQALRRAQAEPLFFRADNHWRPVAAYAAAEEVARAVAGLRLPPSPRPGARLGDWTNASMTGRDLADLLPPAERARFRPEPFRVRQLPRAAGGLLAEEETPADVAVVGNSFVVPSSGFPAAMSQALGRPIALFSRTGNFGHWKMLTDFLAGPLFRPTRPKLIIWQLLEGNMEHMPDQRGYFGANAMSPAAFLAAVRAAAG